MIGPKPCELAPSVDWNVLVSHMHDNLNSYWVRWTRRPDRILILLSDWGIQWSILGVLRQFYSFRENTITTKIRAGNYALDCVPAHWHRLIREAIRTREGKEKSTYQYRATRALEAINFLNYIIYLCNAR